VRALNLLKSRTAAYPEREVRAATTARLDGGGVSRSLTIAIRSTG
jgi:hypothetical protein